MPVSVHSFFPDRSRTLTASSAALPLFMGQPVLAPTRLSGCEHLCSLFDYTLELKSPEDLLYSPSMASNFPLEDMNGREISVCIELDGKGPIALGSGTRQINALITQARYLRPEGRHHVYGLTLRPWLWLATLNQTCRVFQDQTVVQILDAVLGFYPFPVDQRLSKTDYPSRDYQVQYNESDYDFIARLCEEWGIAWWFEHSNGAHRLVLADGMGAFNANPSAAYGSVSFYPPGHKTDEEYVSALRVADSLTSTAWASTDTDYTRERADLKVLAQSDRALPEASVSSGASSGSSSGASSEVASQHMGEVFSYPLDSAQPKAGAGGLSAAGNEAMDEGALFARVRLQSLQAHTHRAYGHGNLRGMVTGCSFKLLKHPQERANIEWLILGTELEIEEIAQESQGSASLLGVNVPAQQWRCAVDFTVQPTALAYRPPLTRTKPLVHGWQRAVVTGPQDKELWTDAYGRVKVVFPWDRDNPRHGEGGGADHTSSCWLRVVSPWAGSQYGAIHIPRVGQEVVVGFENGDPDRPLITGRVVNNANLPPWSLPENQSLSGIRSKELYGAQHNHLVFDDTQGEVQTQLSSDHQLSQLNLGKVVRIADNRGRMDKRGEGFELRTDAHGVVRAKEGLLITTHGRGGASGHILDMGETTARLEGAQHTHAQMAELAKQHQAQEDGQQDEVAKVLQGQNQAIRGEGNADAQAGKFPELGQPHLTLASPAGIEATTAGSLHLHAEENLAVTTHQNVSIASGKGFFASVEKGVRIFVHKLGMRMILGKNDISMQALQDSMHFLAALKITERADKIFIEAEEEVMVTGGGSTTIWNKSGITEMTDGSITVHAAVKSFMPGESLTVVMPELPQVAAFDEQFRAFNEKLDRAVTGMPYALVRVDGTLIEGVTDRKGYTVRVQDLQAETVKVTWGGLLHEGLVIEEVNDEEQSC